jgi:thermostable 8-oxoguanine DNA glycosylase
MKIIWEIENKDIKKAQAFFTLHCNNPFVKQRIERNLGQKKAEISKPVFFQTMVACLITTQQRSGPESAVTRFLNLKPFPLNYRECSVQRDLYEFVHKIISGFGGLRRSNRIADELTTNFGRLEHDLWDRVFEIIDKIQTKQTVESERAAAEFLELSLKGIGPKQGRNLLQSLGLTKYEIPIDSRITKWLNSFGFPVKLTANALSDPHYYNFISDGIQELCKNTGITPCVLDAVIFASFDKGGWTEENVVW